jgi:hypothetical protein
VRLPPVDCSGYIPVMSIPWAGRWASHAKATVVEACLTLDLHRLAEAGVMAANFSGTASWAEPGASIGLAVSRGQDGTLVLRLVFSSDGREKRQEIPLERQRGRWFGRCPLEVEGHTCARRVRCLYLPPGGREFGCRHCHELTYVACQHGHRLDAAHRLLAAELGLSVTELRRTMRHLAKSNRG